MSFKNSLKIAGATLSLLALVSCGGDSNGSSRAEKRRQEQRTCEELNCLSSVDWKIYLQGRAFPTKTRVEINNATLIDECLTKNQYMIDRSTDPQMIALERFAVPTQGELKIVITDLGYNCSAEDDSVFFAQDNVPFDLVKTDNGSQEIIVNL